MTHTLTFTLRTYRYTFRWCPYFYRLHCHFLTQLLFTFHNFFSLFLPKFLSLFTLWIFLFTIRLKVLAFGGHMQCVFGHMCLNSWGGLPWKTRCPTTVLCTNVYVRMYVYVCLDSPNLRACPCYVRACVRTLTLISGAHAATTSGLHRPCMRTLATFSWK